MTYKNLVRALGKQPASLQKCRFCCNFYVTATRLISFECHLIRRSRLGPRLVNCQFMNPDQHTHASLPPEGLKYIHTQRLNCVLVFCDTRVCLIQWKHPYWSLITLVVIIVFQFLIIVSGSILYCPAPQVNDLWCVSVFITLWFFVLSWEAGEREWSVCRRRGGRWYWFPFTECSYGYCQHYTQLTRSAFVTWTELGFKVFIVGF